MVASHYLAAGDWDKILNGVEMLNWVYVVLGECLTVCIPMPQVWVMCKVTCSSHSSESLPSIGLYSTYLGVISQ